MNAYAPNRTPAPENVIVQSDGCFYRFVRYVAPEGDVCFFCDVPSDDLITIELLNSDLGSAAEDLLYCQSCYATNLQDPTGPDTFYISFPSA